MEDQANKILDEFKKSIPQELKDKAFDALIMGTEQDYADVLNEQLEFFFSLKNGDKVKP